MLNSPLERGRVGLCSGWGVFMKQKNTPLRPSQEGNHTIPRSFLSLPNTSELEPSDCREDYTIGEAQGRAIPSRGRAREGFMNAAKLYMAHKPLPAFAHKPAAPSRGEGI